MAEQEPPTAAPRPRRGFRADYRVWTRGDAAVGLFVELFGERPPRAQKAGSGADVNVEISVLCHPDGRFRMDWGPDTPTPGRRRIFDGERDWSIWADGPITVSSWPKPLLRGLLPPYERRGLRPVPGPEPETTEEIDGRRVRRVRLERYPGTAASRYCTAGSDADAEAGADTDEGAGRARGRTVTDFFNTLVSDAVELAIDDELGIALSEHVFSGDGCVRGRELRRITVLDTFDEADFVFTPPPGARIVRLERHPDGRPSVDMPLSVGVEVAASVLKAAGRLLRRAAG